MESARRELPPVEALSGLTDPACEDLRGRVAAAGYHDRLVMEAERIAPRQFDAVRLPLVHAWLARRGGPGSTLAALFSYAGAVADTSLQESLGAALVKALSSAGILAPAPGETVVSRYRLSPLEGLLILSDPPESGPETVMGPGPTTMLLADLIPGSPGEVLDVGCGAGTLALVAAARGARRAVGVDLSERAILVSRFNARLNRSTAEFRAGDLLAPVRGERFDLIVSQPPYVVLPPGMANTTYLHGGPLGEELALRFAASFPEALSERGLALLHFDAPSLPGRPLVERLRDAVGGARVDLAVLTSPGPSADLEAAAYGALEDPTLGERYRASVRRYREHLAASGVEGFTRALAVLRTSAPASGGVALQVPAALDRMTPANLSTFLSGIDLATGPEDALLATEVRLAQGAWIVEEEPVDGSGDRKVRLRLEAGIATDQEVGEATRALIAALQASSTVAGALDVYAAGIGLSPQDARGAVLAAVREGLARGVYSVSMDSRKRDFNPAQPV